MMTQLKFREFTLLLAALALLSISAVAQANLDAAIKQFEAKKYQEAKSAFEQAANADPKNAVAVFYLGRIAFQQNKADDSVKWFEAAVKLQESNSSYHHWLGQAYGKKALAGTMLNRASLAGKVKDELLKAVSLDANNWEARADLARFYGDVPSFLGGSQEKALEQVELIKKGNALQGWLLAGELLANKNKNAEAERAYLEAEKLQTNDFEATMKLGRLYQQVKEFDKAFAAFERVVKAKPGNVAALYQIGRTAGLSGKNLDRGLEAFSSFDHAVFKDDRDSIIGLHWWRGRIYETKGDLQKARADFEYLEKISPGHPDTRLALDRVRPKTESANAKRTPGLFSLEPSSFQSFDGEAIECETGRLIVPENRHKKDSRLIELAFLRIKTKAKQPLTPVVWLSGGPGGSGIVNMKATEYFRAMKAVSEVADVIVLDQRGTGGSLPNLFCPGTFADLPATMLRSREDATKAFVEGARRCADVMREKGIDFDGYTILESADDVDDLRHALKLEKVSLWGHSYGTQLALAAVRRHEKNIDRLVILGVEGVSNTDKLPSDIDRYFEELAALIKNDPRAGANIPDLMGLMRSVTAKLDREPITVSVTLPTTGEKREMVVSGFGVRFLAFATALGNTRNLPIIPVLFASLERGDTKVLSEMLVPMMTRGLFPADLYLIDGASGVSAERRAQINREAQTALFGDVTNFLFPAVNEIWRPKDLGDEFRAPVKSNRPALFISGTLDANTPPHRAEESRRGFPNSAHLIIENAGHQDYFKHEGVSTEIVRFLKSGKIEASTFTLPAPQFLPMTANR
jgi:pimeloyl-ACP methyl ester carboxylesterase/cytochrome c-type biogenesis protein CcmH/NrfG